MNKKILSIILMILLAFSFTACSEPEENEGNAASSMPKETAFYKITFDLPNTYSQVEQKQMEELFSNREDITEIAGYKEDLADNNSNMLTLTVETTDYNEDEIDDALILDGSLSEPEVVDLDSISGRLFTRQNLDDYVEHCFLFIKDGEIYNLSTV